jgi:hypothetical protein
MEKFLTEKFKQLMNILGVDPLYGVTLLATIVFLIMFRKNWYIFSKKNTTKLERTYRLYFMSEILAIITLLIACLMHFFKMF